MTIKSGFMGIDNFVLGQKGSIYAVKHVNSMICHKKDENNYARYITSGLE